MNRKAIRIIIVFATFSLIGVIATQIYWVNKAFNLQEKQFNQRVHVALTNVTSEILRLSGDSSEVYEPIKQIGSNYFTAAINDTLHPYLLESLLKEEFMERNLKTDFEYVIYDCFTDSIVYGNYVNMEAGNEAPETPAEERKWKKDGHYFGVYFPNKTSYLVNQMEIWIFSTAILLIVIIYFAYTTMIILKQKRLSEIKSDFINNLTHEFKTPISTISLSTEVLLNEKMQEQPEKIKQYAHIIQQENNRLKIQVDKVLQLATLDRETIVLDKEVSDIHPLIETALAGLELIIKERNGHITTHFNATNSEVMVDKLHFTNIIFNLIDNAVKYSPGPPRIEVITKDVKQRIEISIRDYGQGISKKEQKFIFDKFYRVPTGDRHDVKGFGLGLSYVKTIVDLHEGQLLLKSESGKGSKFTIVLEPQ